MDLLRQTPFNFSISFSVPSISTDYILEIYGNSGSAIVSEVLTSSVSGVITYELPMGFQKYDGSYPVYIYTIDVDDLADETVVIDTLYIYRPYINPITLSTGTDCDAAEYTQLEKTARFILDTLVGGFYYESKAIELTGLGLDYLPLPKKASRINYVYQNNVAVYNRLVPLSGQYTYLISPDKTSLTIDLVGEYNKKESRSVQLPMAASDSLMLSSENYDQVISLTNGGGSSFFPKGADFTIYGEWGWPVVPQEIKEATRILIDDIKCGRLAYVSRYVTEYETDQFRVKYGDLASSGSGNLIVDKIIQKYSIPIYRLGVL
jgi:hypothetical protein